MIYHYFASKEGLYLAVLEEAGLVTTERRGRTKLHYFDRAPLAAITRRWPITREDSP